jgi:hypothetical protein
MMTNPHQNGRLRSSLRMRRAPRAAWVRAFAVVLLGVPAAWHAYTLVRIVGTRFGCPLDIEYLESAHVYHAWRLGHGLPLYGDPSSGGFATFPYPPLYWVALRGAATLFGFTVQAGRAVSIAGLILAAAVLVSVVVRSAPGRFQAALFAVLVIGGICAGFPMSDGSYDWTRSDTLAGSLIIGAAAAAGDGRLKWPRAIATALLLTLSIYTKQSAAVFAAWIVAFSCACDWKGGLRLGVLCGIFCGVPFAALQLGTHGWFLRWLLSPARHPLHPWWVGAGGLGRCILRAPFLLFMPWGLVVLKRRGGFRRTTALWMGLLAVAIGAGTLMSIKQFTCGNVWIPEPFLAWPIAALLANDWLALRPAQDRDRATWTITAAGAAVLLALVYDASPFLPTTDRWGAAARLDAIAKSVQGGVVVTTSPMVGIRAGGPPEQPILAAFEDARSAGMPLDYVAALLHSGARWVVTTDRYQGTDHAPEPRMRAYFTPERTYDFDLHSLASWDRPKHVVLWRRIAPPK